MGKGFGTPIRVALGVLTLAFVVVSIAGVFNEIHAYKLKCRRANNTSPYPIRTHPEYDHDRFGTWPRDIYLEYGAYVTSFDSDDDNDGDGTNDLRAVPEWVAYEIKRYGTDTGGDFNPPTPSIARPTWYEHEKLVFLFNQPGVTKSKLDESYRGVGNEWNRGHLAMKSHANRVGWREACNTHFFHNAGRIQSGRLVGSGGLFRCCGEQVRVRMGHHGSHLQCRASSRNHWGRR